MARAAADDAIRKTGCGRSPFLRLGACCLLLALQHSPSASGEAQRGGPPAGAIAGLQRRYASVEGLRADFRQTYRGPGIEQTESGTVFMKRPGLMRWEYRAPEVKLFVADGRETYLYTPADRQVLVRRFNAADLRNTPLPFLLGQGDAARSFDISLETDWKPRIEGTILLRFTPRSPEAGYSYAVMECDEATYDIRRVVIREPIGNTSEFVFSGLQTNVKIDGGQFQFKIPRGVEVIRLNDK